MKTTVAALSGILGIALSATAAPGIKPGDSLKKAHASAPAYHSESPLPKGWPEPGPYDQVVRKKYPAYRAAVTADGSQNGGFMKLFKHIKRNNIPMTAPVEMTLEQDDKSSMKMERMAFLYQSPEVGKTGADGEQVEVRDMPAVEVLAFAWQGTRNKAATARARQAIDAALANQNLKAAGYRLFGYNSPFMPASKQTHELQAVLVEK